MDKPTNEAFIGALCTGGADRICLELAGVQQRGSATEIEPYRALLWWMRSYLLAARYCPDLSRRELKARDYVLKVVEFCIINGLDETLPIPGLSWTPKLLARKGPRGHVGNVGPDLESPWRMLWVWALQGREAVQSRKPEALLATLQAEILAALDRDDCAYPTGPVTRELLRENA